MYLLRIYFKKDSAKLIYTQNMAIQFLRAFFGTIAMFFGYSALTFIPIAQASVISFTKVFFVSLLASLILKENLNALGHPRGPRCAPSLRGGLTRSEEGIYPARSGR
mgnify:CR=1 FL=1